MKILLRFYLMGALLLLPFTVQAAETYVCPMHPQIVSDKPGEKCPICGMDLVSSGQEEDREGKGHNHGDMTPRKNLDEDDSTEPKAVISIKPEYVQKMGVRTETVQKISISGGLRLTGIVMVNERERQNLFSQVEGRVDSLLYSAPGDHVKKGELFYTLYSPELLSLQNDYLAAMNGGYKDLAEAARRRLALLGVDEKVIQDIVQNRKAYDAVPFYIRKDGVLTEILIRQGSYLEKNAEIGEVQDLSTIWVEAAVPEKDMPKLKEGDMAEVNMSGSLPPLRARVEYVYPSLDPDTRTGKARLVVDNPGTLLKPEGYVTVVLSPEGAETKRLAIPSSAVLKDSSGDHVIVSLGNGKFQARDIKAGIVAGGRTEVIEGLLEGESVVTNGQFLIDSESNLREALKKVSAEDDNGR